VSRLAKANSTPQFEEQIRSHQVDYAPAGIAQIAGCFLVRPNWVFDASRCKASSLGHHFVPGFLEYLGPETVWIVESNFTQ
jgi:hypothetical protein